MQDNLLDILMTKEKDGFNLLNLLDNLVLSTKLTTVRIVRIV